MFIRVPEDTFLRTAIDDKPNLGPHIYDHWKKFLWAPELIYLAKLGAGTGRL